MQVTACDGILPDLDVTPRNADKYIARDSPRDSNPPIFTIEVCQHQSVELIASLSRCEQRNAHKRAIHAFEAPVGT